MKKIVFFSLIIWSSLAFSYENYGDMKGVALADDGFAYFWIDDARTSGLASCAFAWVGSTPVTVFAIDLSTQAGEAMYAIALNAFNRNDITAMARGDGSCVGNYDGAKVTFIQEFYE